MRNITCVLSISQPVDVSYNWWGTTDASAINQTISDYKNNPSVGKVNFTPFLNQSNPQAPAAETINYPPAPTPTPYPTPFQRQALHHPTLCNPETNRHLRTPLLRQLQRPFQQQPQLQPPHLCLHRFLPPKSCLVHHYLWAAQHLLKHYPNSISHE